MNRTSSSPASISRPLSLADRPRRPWRSTPAACLVSARTFITSRHDKICLRLFVAASSTVQGFCSTQQGWGTSRPPGASITCQSRLALVAYSFETRSRSQRERSRLKLAGHWSASLNTSMSMSSSGLVLPLGLSLQGRITLRGTTERCRSSSASRPMMRCNRHFPTAATTRVPLAALVASTALAEATLTFLPLGSLAVRPM